MNNTTITLLTDGIYPFVMGGMQKHSYYLAKYFAKNKVVVELYHCVPNDKPLIEDLQVFTGDELKYIKHHCFHFPVETQCIASLPGHYIRENKRLSELYLKHFQLIHHSPFAINHSIYAQGFTATAFIKAKRQGLELPEITVNFHGLEMLQKAPSLRVKMEYLLFRKAVKFNIQNADNVVSLGGKLTGILKNIKAKNIIEQGIGIENNWLFKNGNHINKKIQFVFIGRYERRKGIEELNKVLKELDFEYSASFQIEFIGPIPKSKQISPLRNGSGRNDITYHGAIYEENRIKEILQASDILISPSWSEGMPTVILEAMASGCAIIATDVGAVSEQVDSSNGWLIEAGNKKQLKQVILDAINLENDMLIDKKKNSIYKIKEKFLWDDVIKKVITDLKPKREYINEACAKDLNQNKKR